jgi:hypothetical protein
MSTEPWEPKRFTTSARGDTIATCRRLRAAGPRLFQI